MSRRPVAAIACLLVLAGCGGFASGGDGAASPTPTATAAPVPTDSPTPRPGPGDVPGLSARDVEDPFALARAHRTMLANTTYTVRTNETTWFPNGTLRSRAVTVSRVEPGSLFDRYHSVTTFGGPVAPAGVPYPNATRVETYAGELVYLAVTYPNGTTTYRSFRPSDFRRRTLALLFSSFETRVVGRTACGNETCYRVASTALDAPGFLAAAFVRLPDRSVVDGSLVALVDRRGFVRAYRVRYRVETPDGTYTAVRRVTYSGLGETTVERPAWVENATTGS